MRDLIITDRMDMFLPKLESGRGGSAIFPLRSLLEGVHSYGFYEMPNIVKESGGNTYPPSIWTFQHTEIHKRGEIGTDIYRSGVNLF